MSSLIKRQASTFVVDFGDVNIPSGLAKDIETEFQQIALGALARIDYRGNLRIGRLPPGAYGMIFGDWPVDPFPWFPDQPGMPDIQIRDHTIIMGEVMKQGLALTRVLGRVRKTGQKVSGLEVLEALVALPSADEGVKRSTSVILSQLRRQMPSDKDLPRAAQAALAGIFKQLDASESVEETAQLLDRLKSEKNYQQVEGLVDALDMASQILEDGRSTIYSPDNPFYEGMGSGDGSDAIAKAKGASDVAKEDVKGGITGFLAGVVAGPKGAGALGVGGALLGSAAEALSQLWDSIFD